MVTEFEQRVYDFLTKNVPSGKVTTYGAIAKALHSSPRAVGQALRKNPFAPQVPCHRVVASDGDLHGYQGRTKGESLSKKETLLRDELVEIRDGKVLPEFRIDI
jgi:methylated-DNA-[protein]-cysteine S-methyltransferase